LYLYKQQIPGVPTVYGYQSILKIKTEKIGMPPTLRIGSWYIMIKLIIIKVTNSIHKCFLMVLENVVYISGRL